MAQIETASIGELFMVPPVEAVVVQEAKDCVPKNQTGIAAARASQDSIRLHRDIARMNDLDQNSRNRRATDCIDVEES